MTRPPVELAVRRAGAGDAETIARLLYDFNCEFDEPTPEPPVLAARLRQLFEAGDTAVLLGGGGPDGLAVLRFRLAIWSAELECSLAELYVAPHQRGRGLGRALMEAAFDAARRLGADRMELATGQSAARAFYERLGFTSGEQGSIDYYYQRELSEAPGRVPKPGAGSGSSAPQPSDQS